MTGFRIGLFWFMLLMVWPGAPMWIRVLLYIGLGLCLLQTGLETFLVLREHRRQRRFERQVRLDEAER